jgi:hypothetical protein
MGCEGMKPHFDDIHDFKTDGKGVLKYFVHIQESEVPYSLSGFSLPVP